MEVLMKRILVVFLVLVLSSTFAFAKGNKESKESMEAPMEMKSIVEIASTDGRFTTLVAALDAAALVDTLQGEGPFTVFAPTDEAFAKLPDGTVEALLNDIPTLTNILLYHVVPGKVMASSVVNLNSADTAAGEQVQIRTMGDKVMVNDAQVVITDIEASNGVIHVIDTVILPPERLASIVDIAVEDGRFTTLVAALDAAGLVDTLQGEGPFTVFAPTDEAFAKLPEGTVEALLGDIPTLSNILLYHVVPGKVMASDVIMLDSATSANGQDLRIAKTGMSVMLNEANVIITDIEASNGVIHVIDAVVLPSS
jgi:transforming growth factor-beta-induced protein